MRFGGHEEKVFKQWILGFAALCYMHLALGMPAQVVESNHAVHHGLTFPTLSCGRGHKSNRKWPNFASDGEGDLLAHFGGKKDADTMPELDAQ